VKNREEILWSNTTKSGRKQEVNLRDRLFELEFNEPQRHRELREEEGVSTGVLRYVGSCRNDGTLLRPEHLVYMLEQVTGLEFQLWHAHRLRMMLNVS